jgi:hypothetical protein
MLLPKVARLPALGGTSDGGGWIGSIVRHSSLELLHFKQVSRRVNYSL